MASFWDYISATGQVAQNMAQGIGSALMAPGNALKSTPDNPVTSDQLIAPAANLAGMVMGGTQFAPAMENAAGMGIRAYHGSPHDFDRFDLSKIGTGEGAQAYGHGLYFAENPAVAESYKRLTPQPQWKDPSYNPWTQPPGRMYEVNINADPGQFLNFDNGGRKLYEDLARKLGNDALGSSRISPKMASEALAEQGIPGIRYLDQGSRGPGSGTSNYVVFNPSIIDIIKKYGIAGLAALGAAGGLAPPKQQAPSL